MSTELWGKSAGELAELICAREVSSREVVQAHLDRITAVHERVNAVVETFPERSLAWADAADAAQAQGRPLGRMHGVPFTAKTNIDFEGSATHEGSAALAGLVAPSDAPVVERFRAAGGVPIGRTNMPDLGLRINTESTLFGATRNPWDGTRTAGGSSGGEGAAIASGQSPIGLGNDVGGSVRNPAYCCGIAAIKPGFGRVPAGNESSSMAPPIASQLMLEQGVLARRVSDLRLGLEIVMGSHRRDPFVVDAPLAGPPRQRRIALVPEPDGGATDAGVADGVRRAGQALADAGYEVVEIQPPMLEDSYIAWSELLVSDVELNRPLLNLVLGEGGKRFLDLTNEDFPTPTPASIMAMHQIRYRIHQAWQEFFFDFGAVVGPTWTQPPFLLGWDIESKENANAVMELFRFVLPANLMGLPAASVPTGIINGLPVGAQIITPRLREDITLNIAEVIENSLGIFTPISPR